MDLVLDWKLIHRSEDDMNRLFLASSFDSSEEFMGKFRLG
jgi:hypothetical protein